jgi:hypothetical protein
MKSLVVMDNLGKTTTMNAFHCLCVESKQRQTKTLNPTCVHPILIRQSPHISSQCLFFKIENVFFSENASCFASLDSLKKKLKIKKHFQTPLMISNFIMIS